MENNHFYLEDFKSLSACNELFYFNSEHHLFFVIYPNFCRGAIDINHPAFGIAAPVTEQRSQVEEQSQYAQEGHQPFRQVYSRTYAILENQLEESERGG